MRSTLLKSICVLFMLRALVAMGFPTNTDKKATSEENSIEGDTAVNDADTSDKIYTCVYIPPELKNCNFSSYRKITEKSWLSGNIRTERKKRELLNDNKENTPTIVSGINKERFSRQKPDRIIIYQIQRCVPPRLPFILPWCTEEDLAKKNSLIYRLTPFVRNSTSPAPLILPDYDI